MDPTRAAREARRRFGNFGLQKERTRATATSSRGSTRSIADLRYAIRVAARRARRSRSSPFSRSALGIGANTAIFCIINAVMLKSLPVDHPEELVAVAARQQRRRVHQSPLGERFAIARTCSAARSPMAKRTSISRRRRSASRQRRLGERRLLLHARRPPGARAHSSQR